MSGDPPGLPRAVDATLAFAALVVSIPVLALAALWVALSSRGPIVFRQERVGRGGKRFVLLKLRSMRLGEAGTRVTAGGDPRVTTAGRFLRRTKLDEIPQLWNVVRGDMALVGPRPEVPDYVDLSDPGWRRVLIARPGLTDPVSLRLRHEENLLASVPGDPADFYRRVLVPFKVSKYIEYQSHRNSLSDIKIILLTALAAVWDGFAPAWMADDLPKGP